MGYYIRVLTPSVAPVSLDLVKADLVEAKLPTALLSDATGADWSEVQISHLSGEVIVNLTRERHGDDGLDEEIEEFLEDIKLCKPASAARWLADYLPTVRCTYAFQLLHGTEVGAGWEILGSVKNTIHQHVGGIIQADSEGFSNEAGYHILWQFRSTVKGPWWMAVLKEGQWVHFEMDLGNREHRAAFRKGLVPAGVTLGDAP